MKNFISGLIILMGISCFGGQILFIREFLIQFCGNELTIGLMLANWLLSEAAGSFVFGFLRTSRNKLISIYAAIQIFIALLMPLGVIAVRLLKTSLPISGGEGLGIVPIFIFSFLIMLPLGFLLGGQFPLISRIYKDEQKKSLAYAVGKSYFFEGMGFALGGIIITYLLIPNINSVAIAFILGCANLVAGCLLIMLRGPRLSSKGILATFIICILIGIAGFYVKYVPLLHEKSLKMQWKNFNLVAYRNSIYGNIAIIKQKNQYVFYYDGLPFMTTPMPNIVFTEDLVNFSTAAVKNPQNIAVIGPGLGGIIDNIFKFPVKRIDYTELDPLVIKMAEKYTSPLTKKELSDKRLKIHNIDGRLFLKQTPQMFDLVIINLPIPSTLIINRFYTRNFFELVERKLNPNGVLALSLPGSLSYLSEEQTDINKCILKTLKTVFSYVQVIPGDYNLYLASKNSGFPVTPEKVISKLKNNKIKSELFTNFYIKDRLDKEKQEWFFQSIQKRKVRLNKDLEPAGVFYSLALWNALFSPELKNLFFIESKLDTYNVIIVLSLFLSFGCFLSFILQKKNNTSPGYTIIPWLVIVTGFSGVSLNLIILFALQTFYGYVYFHVGILISSFMFGLTSGSFLMTKWLKDSKFNLEFLLKIDGVFIIFCILMHVFLITMLHIANTNIPALGLLLEAAVLSLTCGFFVGFEFPLANKIYLEADKSKEKPRNILYASDMFGSSLGAITISIILIPTLGLLATVTVICCVKFWLLALFKITTLKAVR